MKFLSSSVLVALTLPLLGSASDSLRYVGCYTSKGSLVSNGTYPYQSAGYCMTVCSKQQKAIIGLADGNECLCGDEAPPSDKKVLKDKCDTQCAGWPAENCGGDGTWSVYEYGLSSSGNSSSPSSTSSSTSSSSSSAGASAATTSTGSAQSSAGSATTSSVAAATSSSGASRGYKIF